jgi:hypothetical protein
VQITVNSVQSCLVDVRMERGNAVSRLLRRMQRDGSDQTVAAKLPFYGGSWPFGLGLGLAVETAFYERF